MSAMSRPAPVRRRNGRTERTRRALTEAALSLFVEQGYDATTTAQIADAAEVSSSTFFKYFPTKADVVFSLFDAVIESADGRVLGRPADEPAAEAVVA